MILVINPNNLYSPNKLNDPFILKLINPNNLNNPNKLNDPNNLNNPMTILGTKTTCLNAIFHLISLQKSNQR
jgi:hypothetical protein